MLLIYLCFAMAMEVFEPLIGKSLRISAEEIERGLVKPESSLAELHILLLKVKGFFPYLFKCTDHRFLLLCI